jgi:hypothetical protein
MKNAMVLLLTLLVYTNSICQENCDSALFKQLIKYGNSKTLSLEDFQKCQTIVNQLWVQHCYDYLKVINNENYRLTSLTYEYGRICLKANPDYAINAFIDYIIDNKNSAEEQIDFSFEKLFVKYPKRVLIDMSKFDSDTKNDLLWRLSWGFVNNRCYGPIDPFDDNPFKAMTVYNNPPKVVLDSTNYKNIYFSLNPEIKVAYLTFKNEIELVLSHILTMIRFNEEQKKKLNK